ncbi:MAG: phenylalanine--tRNA ligase subunit alpha, partial [Dehalococcoidia bacterium]
MTPTTAESIQDLTQQALQELEGIDDLSSLDQWRVTYLGRRGGLTTILRGLSQLDLEQRRELGALGNRSKNTLEENLERRTREINAAQLARSATQDRIDVSLPGRPTITGRLHPTTQVVREITDAFVSMGFSIVEGPEVELDHYNFEMLNIPQGHPARDMWNSIWLDYRDQEGNQPMLLRTHTSPMQARVMEST